MANEPKEMPNEFEETVQAFLDIAKNLESRLSKPQIHAAFLYASSCYTAEFLADRKIEHKDPVEAQISEFSDMYKHMLENGVSHYSGGNS